MSDTTWKAGPGVDKHTSLCSDQIHIISLLAFDWLETGQNLVDPTAPWLYIMRAVLWRLSLQDWWDFYLVNVEVFVQIHTSGSERRLLAASLAAAVVLHELSKCSISVLAALGLSAWWMERLPFKRCLLALCRPRCHSEPDVFPLNRNTKQMKQMWKALKGQFTRFTQIKIASTTGRWI